MKVQSGEQTRTSDSPQQLPCQPVAPRRLLNSLGGVATAAYLDLIIRSCPPGLQGTTMMMSATLLSISIRFGDVLGTYLYDQYGGFTVRVIATTAIYALILPVLLLVPRSLIAAPDGQPSKLEAV